MGTNSSTPLPKLDFLYKYTGSHYLCDMLSREPSVKKLFWQQINEGISIINNMKDHDWEGDNWIKFDDELRTKLPLLIDPSSQILSRYHDQFFRDFIRAFVRNKISYIKKYNL